MCQLRYLHMVIVLTVVANKTDNKKERPIEPLFFDLNLTDNESSPI